MSDFIEVIAVVEGKTEEVFINSLLQPYLASKNIFMYATQVTKPGQKGGDVRFSRVQNDIGLHLKQRDDIYVTTFVDYYGTSKWPGLDSVHLQASPIQIADTVGDATLAEIEKLFPDLRADRRFIPYIAVHEFEALLFSDSNSLALGLGIKEEKITSVLTECGEPEAINNSRETAPSKRLNCWSKRGKFAKTTAGIAIAKAIGIPTMREKCPVFNKWIATFEEILEKSN